MLRGNEYLAHMQNEMAVLEDAFEKQFFIDEVGTAGNQLQK